MSNIITEYSEILLQDIDFLILFYRVGPEILTFWVYYENAAAFFYSILNLCIHDHFKNLSVNHLKMSYCAHSRAVHIH